MAQQRCLQVADLAGDERTLNGGSRVGDRGEMTVEVSSKGAGFASDTSNIRIRHRVDGRFWPQSTYTTKASQTVSPLVVLD